MNPIFRALVRAMPIIIMVARRAWPHISQALQENPQLAVGAKDKVASFSGRHRKATVEGIEERIAALRAHILTMPESTNAAVVYGSHGLSRGDAIARLDQIDSSAHALQALSEKARPAALRRISYELDRLAGDVIVPRS